MLLLLDTHALVWLTEATGDLSAEHRRMVDEAAGSDGVLVSAISFWEVAMLSKRQRINLTQPLHVWREIVLSRPGVTEAMIDSRITISAVTLPGDLHTDPADRFLIATARHMDATLMTRDTRIIDYGAAGHVKVAPI